MYFTPLRSLKLLEKMEEETLNRYLYSALIINLSLFLTLAYRLIPCIKVVSPFMFYILHTHSEYTQLTNKMYLNF